MDHWRWRHCRSNTFDLIICGKLWSGFILILKQLHKSSSIFIYSSCSPIDWQLTEVSFLVTVRFYSLLGTVKRDNCKIFLPFIWTYIFSVVRDVVYTLQLELVNRFLLNYMYFVNFINCILFLIGSIDSPLPRI